MSQSAASQGFRATVFSALFTTQAQTLSQLALIADDVLRARFARLAVAADRGADRGRLGEVLAVWSLEHLEQTGAEPGNAGTIQDYWRVS